MSDCNKEFNQTDEEILRDEVSDDAVEAAFGATEVIQLLRMVLIASLVRHLRQSCSAQMRRA
jgi:hypothetical protein